MNLLQILEKIMGGLPGIILGVETALHAFAGPVKKDEALKGVNAILDGVVATGTAVVRDPFLTIAGDLIDVYVAGAHALGAFTHGTQER